MIPTLYKVASDVLRNVFSFPALAVRILRRSVDMWDGITSATSLVEVMA